MWRGVCIHLHLPIYMVLIVLLVFVCVRTSEQMGKLINGGSKISLLLSRSFILLFFCFECLFRSCCYRLDDKVTAWRVIAQACAHIYKYNDDFIGNGCLWSIASQLDVQHVDKETERNRRTDERRRKVLAIVRIFANMCRFDTVPIFQSILLIPILSLFL
jgi:hypothetical protein